MMKNFTDPCIDSDHLTCHWAGIPAAGGTYMMTIEASELRSGEGYSMIWVRSKKSGAKRMFRFMSTRRTGDGDIQFWDYRCEHLPKVLLRIYNT